MRPTIQEQIEGTCKLLDQVIAPELADTHVRQVLSGLTTNLRMLGSSWTQLLPFLHWDNQATIGLLTAAEPAVNADLARRLTAATSGPEPDTIDFEAVTTRNDELRALLSEVVAELDPTSGPASASAYRDIVSHFDLRARRYPMRMVPELSASSAAKES